MNLTGKLKATASRNTLLFLHKTVPRLKKLWRFKGLLLYVPSGVFNPVFTIVPSILTDYIHPENKRFLDLGSGSGVLPLYAKLKAADFSIGYDNDPIAIATARVNAELNNLEVIFTRNINLVRDKGPYDMIVSNPPYLSLDPKVKLDLLWCGLRDESKVISMFILANELLSEKGVFITVISSITGFSSEFLTKVLMKTGFKKTSIIEKNMLFEKIFVAKAYKN